uniref:Uncharacterized protein n=1 Tax=Pectinophora gossypiella TaxID=13191 RepID=A0A1E1VZ70_PECGO
MPKITDNEGPINRATVYEYASNLLPPEDMNFPIPPPPPPIDEPTESKATGWMTEEHKYQAETELSSHIPSSSLSPPTTPPPSPQPPPSPTKDEIEVVADDECDDNQ